MNTTLEILLWFSLGLCTVTLILSFNIIRRFQKIAKLTNLVYDQLVITKGEGDPFASILEEQRDPAKEMAEPAANALEPLEADFFNEPKSDPSHNKVMTKAESHLVKVLQSKYHLNEENSPPTGNDN